MKSVFQSVLTVVALNLIGCGGSEPADNNSQDGTPTKTSSLQERPPTKFALLVGCTSYDNLDSAFHLEGPSNDVQLMKEMLLDRFEFRRENIKSLVEGAGLANRPIRRYIEREIRNLTEKLRQGDSVVIFLSGHGSQQPDDDPKNEDDLEPDGLDEVFCPADVGDLEDEENFTIRNAISDDELRGWIDEIRKKQASVWFIVDACHSGTLTRGARTYRQIPREMLLSKRAMQSAPKSVPQSRSGSDNDNGMADTRSEIGGLVAIYASQPHEPTFEMPLPIDGRTSRMYGMLTYHLVKVLSATEGALSYSELVQRIHAEYIALGCRGPTPLIEGADRHKEVLGTKEWPKRSLLTLTHSDNGLMINAGSLHGLTNGTILAVYPRAGEKQPEELLGYVNVTGLTTVSSRVRPCKYRDSEINVDLPIGARCEVVHVDYGDMKLKVAVDPSLEGVTNPQAAGAFRETLNELADKDDSVFSIVKESSDADWFVGRDKQGRYLLIPTTGRDRLDDAAGVFGPSPQQDASAWLERSLGQITRATNLLKVSTKSSQNRKSSLLARLLGVKIKRLKIELLRLRDENDKEGTAISWSRQGLELMGGDLIAFRIHNPFHYRVDVSLLFVDSGFGIDAIYPPSNTVVDNRIDAGESLMIGPMRVDAKSTGLEHVVIIAMEGEGQPLDFSWLAQPSIERIEKTASTRSAQQNSLTSPLGGLLKQAMYASGQTRGLQTTDAKTVSTHVISWHTSNPTSN